MYSKADLLRALDQARELLWKELDALKETDAITPGITNREVYAHIAGWEALVFEALREHIYSTPARKYPFRDVDTANADFIAERRSLKTESIKRECEINRFAIKTLLAAIPAEGFEKPVRFPWGEETILSFIQGAINHEREHTEEVIRVRRSNRSGD